MMRGKWHDSIGRVIFVLKELAILYLCIGVYFGYHRTIFISNECFESTWYQLFVQEDTWNGSWAQAQVPPKKAEVGRQVIQEVASWQ